MKAFLFSNWPQKLAALAIALLLWQIVQTLGQARQRDTLPSIALDTSTLPEGLAITAGRTTISVDVTALRDELPPIDSSDITASVDLTGAEEGEGTYDVTLDYPAGIDRLAELRPRPDRVKLTIERIVSKKLRVQPKPFGSNERYTIRRWVFDPPEVTVEGVEGKVDEAVLAQVSIDLSRLEPGGRYLRNVEVLDESGSPIPRLTVDPERIEIRAELDPLPTEKRLIVMPNWKGAPAFGYHVSGYEINPSFVAVTGEPGAVLDLSTIETEPIDISGIRGRAERRIGLVLPEGLTLKGDGRVLVTVRVEKTSDSSSSP
ncbi:MAG: hypothetical protein IH851_03830 [Armatimonadetes bacterium]|nr:hypothetical protein [Armatimonadota bacterium]